MDKKRSKPFDIRSKCSRCWNCCACRRRNICSRMTPFLLQILIVVAVWMFFKMSCSTGAYGSGSVSENEGNPRVVKSTDEHAVSLCQHEEFIKGSALRIEDIVSMSTSLSSPDSEGNRKQYFLHVDVLTVNEEQGIPTLYSSGTPVIMDGLLKGHNSGGLMDGQKEEDEFFYDNSIEEKDLDDFTKLDRTDDSMGDGKMMNGSANADGVLVKSHAVDDDGTGGVDGGVDIETDDNNNNNNLRRENEVDSMQAANGDNLVASKTSFAFGDDAAAAVQNQNDQVGIQNGVVPPNGDSPNQSLHVHPDFDHRQDIEENRAEGKGQSPGQSGVMGRNDNNNNMGSNEATGGLNPKSQGEVQSQPLMMRQEQDGGVSSGERPNSDGLKARLVRFKTEFYGTPVGDASDFIPSTYKMNNPALCEGMDKIDVLFLIFSIPQSNEQRQRIRATFANAALFTPFSVAHVFIVGETSSPNFQANLNKEQENSHDVVQGEFVDKPETQTTKGLMGFRWVTTFCSKARFVLKLSEDVFVDTAKLLQGLLPAVANVAGPKSILCFLIQNALIPRSGPNAFDSSVFPKSSKMRPYCKGFAVLTTPATLSSLLAVSEHVPLFRFDDLYLFGILPFVAGGIEVYDLGNKRAFHDFGIAVVNCYRDLQDKCPYVATKAFSARFSSLWGFVTARGKPGAQDFQGNPSLWNIKEYQASFYT